MMVRVEKTTASRDAGHTLRWGIVAWLVLNHFIFMTLLLPVGYLEGKLHPVTDPITITSVTPVDGGVIISADAIKHRDCTKWSRTEGHLGSRDGVSVAMPRAQHLDPPQMRNTGILTWDRIFVPHANLSEVYADAYHNCHPFWQTVSPFWR